MVAPSDSASKDLPSAAEQFSFSCPIRRRHVFENHVDVLRVCAGITNNALRYLGSNGLFGGCFFPFKPGNAYDGHKNLLTLKNGCLLTNSGEALIDAAVAGCGVLLQPLETVEQYLASGQLATFLPEDHAPTRPMHILYTPDRRMTPKLRSFIDFVMANLGVDAKEAAA